MKNKKGQFYLISAIIIVLAIAGIASVKTYAVVMPEPRVIKDLGSELEEETSRIIDYGIYNIGEDLNDLLDNFTDTEFAPYFLQKTRDTGIVFIYGNKTDLFAVQYNQTITGTLSATIGTGIVNWQPVNEFTNRTRIVLGPGDENIEVDLLNKTFRFSLKDNEMFYFIIIQEKEGETHVERN